MDRLSQRDWAADQRSQHFLAGAAGVHQRFGDLRTLRLQRLLRRFRVALRLYGAGVREDPKALDVRAHGRLFLDRLPRAGSDRQSHDHQTRPATEGRGDSGYVIPGESGAASAGRIFRRAIDAPEFPEQRFHRQRRPDGAVLTDLARRLQMRPSSYRSPLQSGLYAATAILVGLGSPAEAQNV